MLKCYTILLKACQKFPILIKENLNKNVWKKLAKGIQLFQAYEAKIVSKKYSNKSTVKLPMKNFYIPI